MKTAGLEQDAAPRAGAGAAALTRPAAGERALARALARDGAGALAGADRGTRARTVQALQRAHGNAAVRRVLARTITYDECSSDQQTKLREAHDRANEMIKGAITKLEAYDGTDPAEVKAALLKHFNSSSTFVARIVRGNLRRLLHEMAWSFDPQYECQAEDSGTTLAWVPWCVPLADIEVYPRFFTKDVDKRADTLVHEWTHKYLCKLDVGYEHEEGYEDQSTIRHLANADSFGEFVFDVR